MSVRTRESGPSERKSWVELHRPLVKTQGLLEIPWRGHARFKSQTPEVRVVSLCIVGWFSGQGSLLAARKLGLQRLSDCFCDLALDSEDVGQFPIKGISPKLGCINCFNKLHVYTHRISDLLHAAFQNMGDAKLSCDLRQIFRRAFVTLRGCTGDHLQI